MKAYLIIFKTIQTNFDLKNENNNRPFHLK